MEPELRLTETPAPELVEAIRAIFTAQSAACGMAADFRPLCIPLERDGALLGGLVGRTGRGWLFVDNLALPASEQGQGLGRRIMALAEAEALRRGCYGSYLYTFQFQAPGFYEKLGYREFGRLEEADPRLSRIWYAKRLA